MVESTVKQEIVLEKLVKFVEAVIQIEKNRLKQKSIINFNEGTRNR